MTPPILVTGAPGYVGTPLVHELLAAGAPVRLAAWDTAAAERAFGDRAEVMSFDFAQPGTSGRLTASSGCSCCDRRRCRRP